MPSGILEIQELPEEPEYYRYFSGQRGGWGTDIPVVRIKDIDQPRVEGGGVIVPMSTSDREVLLEIELKQAKRKGITPPSWSGYVEYSGRNPGKAILATVDYLNELVKKNGWPLWRDPQFESHEDTVARLRKQLHR